PACAAAVFPLSYAWSLVGLPTGSHAALNNAAAASPSFDPDRTGTYTVALAVTDAAGNRSATVTADVAVSSTCTAALTVTVASAGAITGKPTALSATVTDPNGTSPCTRA